MGLLDGLLGDVGGLVDSIDADVAVGADVSVAGITVDTGTALGIHPTLPDLSGILGSL